MRVVSVMVAVAWRQAVAEGAAEAARRPTLSSGDADASQPSQLYGRPTTVLVVNRLSREVPTLDEF